MERAILIFILGTQNFNFWSWLDFVQYAQKTKKKCIHFKEVNIPLKMSH